MDYVLELTTLPSFFAERNIGDKIAGWHIMPYGNFSVYQQDTVSLIYAKMYKP